MLTQLNKSFMNEGWKKFVGRIKSCSVSAGNRLTMIPCHCDSLWMKSSGNWPSFCNQWIPDQLLFNGTPCFDNQLSIGTCWFQLSVTGIEQYLYEWFCCYCHTFKVIWIAQFDGIPLEQKKAVNNRRPGHFSTLVITAVFIFVHNILIHTGLLLLLHVIYQSIYWLPEMILYNSLCLYMFCQRWYYITHCVRTCFARDDII